MTEDGFKNLIDEIDGKIKLEKSVAQSKAMDYVRTVDVF